MGELLDAKSAVRVGVINRLEPTQGLEQPRQKYSLKFRVG